MKPFEEYSRLDKSLARMSVLRPYGMICVIRSARVVHDFASVVHDLQRLHSHLSVRTSSTRQRVLSSLLDRKPRHETPMFPPTTKQQRSLVVGPSKPTPSTSRAFGDCFFGATLQSRGAHGIGPRAQDARREEKGRGGRCQETSHLADKSPAGFC